jgi:serine/threonine protein kinase
MFVSSGPISFIGPDKITFDGGEVGKNGIVFDSDIEFGRSCPVAFEGKKAPTVPISSLDQLVPQGVRSSNSVSRYVLREDSQFTFAVKIMRRCSVENLSLAACLPQIVDGNNAYTVQLYNAFYRSHSLHLVMEYMDGGALEELLRINRRLSEPVAAYITGQVLHALALLHRPTNGRNGVLRPVQRVINPSHILLAQDGRVKLAHVGVSDESDMVVVHPPYIGPECIKRDNSRTSQSDIWSVGVIAAEMVQGGYPFGHPHTAVFRVLFSIVQFQQSEFRSFPLSAWCEDFLARSMAPSEEGRWPAAELIHHPWITSNENKGREELKELLHTITCQRET